MEIRKIFNENNPSQELHRTPRIVIVGSYFYWKAGQKMNRVVYGIIVIFIASFISACSVGPDYKKPVVQIPAAYKEKESDKIWQKAAPQDNYERGLWWQVFNDPELNNLESQVNLSNQTIAAAKASYLQARALVAEARAAYFPTVTASAIITRQNQGAANTNFSGNTTSNGTYNSHSLLLDASWEPDIWGTTRRSVEANRAGAEAAAAALALARLSAQASLAQYYFELRAVDTDQKLLDQTVIDNQKLLEYTKHRYVSGVAALSDIVQAESQLEAAQALAINNGINRAQYEHAIAMLTGQPPSSFSLPSAPSGVQSPPEIPLQLPSALLERRPDIAEAERKVAQANAQIGVAVSAFYPSLTLSASGSLQGMGLAHWFSLPSLVWSVGPALAETLFDGGLRSAVTQAARANYEATAANYRQTVLSAFQDVEDNLAALHILNSEYGVQNKAAENARLVLRLVTNQYKAGTVDYSAVVVAQSAAFSAAKTAADINGLRMSTAAGLIKSLGGGWHQ
jgi:NodT family efflux transporter outer membrane factor (OMF) lipoprotein